MTVKRAGKYGTAIVLVHLAVNVMHGAAHRALHVGLGPAARLFVLGVILLCPLIAMLLLWTSQERLGLLVLALSMAASLVFGLYNHFLAMGPDHVGQVPGPWGTIFAVTACLLLLTEAVGIYVSLHFLHYEGRASKAARMS